MRPSLILFLCLNQLTKGEEYYYPPKSVWSKHSLFYLTHTRLVLWSIYKVRITPQQMGRVAQPQFSFSGSFEKTQWMSDFKLQTEINFDITNRNVMIMITYINNTGNSYKLVKLCATTKVGKNWKLNPIFGVFSQLQLPPMKAEIHDFDASL